MSESGIVALSYTVLDVAATKHAAVKAAPATKAAKPAASKAAKPAASKAERAVPEPKPKGTAAVVIEHNPSSAASWMTAKSTAPKPPPSEAPKVRGGQAAAASKPTVEELSKPPKAEALKPSPPQPEAVAPIAVIAAASPRSWPTKPSSVAAATPEPQSPSEELSLRPAKRTPAARSEPHPKTVADPSPRGSRAGGRPSRRKAEARSVVRADDEMVDNPYPGAALSSVSSTGQVQVVNPYVHREIERERQRAAATIAPLLAPLFEAERRELERRECLLEQQRWQKMMEQQEKLVQAGITAMSVARQEREVEMRSLEAKLAEMTQQRHTAYAEEAETLQEDAVQSVVQHLSSFGLNRNLPWHIYATRPKRFGRGGAAAPAAPAGPPPLDAASAVEQLDALYQYNPYSVLDTPELGPASGGAAPAAPPRSTRRRMASIYDRPARPHSFVSPRQPRDYRANEALPPVRGAQPPGPASPRLGPRLAALRHAACARPPGAYDGG